MLKPRPPLAAQELARVESHLRHMLRQLRDRPLTEVERDVVWLAIDGLLTARLTATDKLTCQQMEKNL